MPKMEQAAFHLIPGGGKVEMALNWRLVARLLGLDPTREDRPLCIEISIHPLSQRPFGTGPWGLVSQSRAHPCGVPFTQGRFWVSTPGKAPGADPPRTGQKRPALKGLPCATGLESRLKATPSRGRPPACRRRAEGA
jgi:hypothetical protein